MAVVATPLAMHFDDVIQPRDFMVNKKEPTVSDAGIRNFGGIENMDAYFVESESVLQLFASKSNVTCEMVQSCIAREVQSGKTLKAVLSETTSRGWPLLLVAAQRNFSGAVNALVDMGAELDCQDPASGWTPLLHAVANGSIDIVQALLAKGAEVNKFTKDDWNPLSLAIQYSRDDIVIMLLNSGACLQMVKRRQPFAYEQYLEAERSHKYEMRRTSCHMLPSAKQYGMRRSTCHMLPF